MSNSFIQAIAVGAVAGFIAGIFSIMVMSPVDPQNPSLSGDLSAGQASHLLAEESRDELLAEIDQLTIQNQQLFERLQKLEQRSQADGRQPVGDWATREELDALRDELARTGKASSAGDGSQQVFEDRVSVALDSIREKEAQDWVTKEAEKKSKLLEQRVGEMTEWLELAASQANQIRTVLANKDARNSELIAMWRNGTDKELLGQIKSKNEELWRNEVRQVLDAEQAKKFDQGMKKADGKPQSAVKLR